MTTTPEQTVHNGYKSLDITVHEITQDWPLTHKIVDTLIELAKSGDGDIVLKRWAESPALPGVLTDETIERAAQALYESERADSSVGGHWLPWEELVAKGHGEPDHAERHGAPRYRRRAQAVLAAARVAPVTPSETGDPFTCTDLGHEDCDGRHPDHRDPSSSPGREKLIRRAKLRVLEWASVDNLPPDVRLIHELVAALAVPPVVNKAKLAEIICNELLLNEDIDELWSLQEALDFSRQLAKDLLGPRQREWLGEGR